jgi:hypothetical protein
MKLKLILISACVFIGSMMACNRPQRTFVVFQPQEDNLFRITFSYPQNWEIQTPSDSNTKTFSSMYVLSPYPASNPKTRENSRRIDFMVSVHSSPQLRMQEAIELFLSAASNAPKSQLLNEKIFQLDGRYARWFTKKQSPQVSEIDQQPYISETIYLLDEDRYYLIGIHISEDELNSPFHTEFKAMIESIKFLP